MVRSEFVSALKKAYPSSLYEGVPGSRVRLTRDQRIERFLGALLDQQVIADRAWEAPGSLRKRLGHLDPARLAGMPVSSIEAAIRGPQTGDSLHRFPLRMATFIQGASRVLVEEYGGDPGKLWRSGLSVPEVRSRLCAIPGISYKIANMWVRILIEDGSRFTEVDRLDIAVDRHVHRVLFRSGHLSRGANRLKPSQVRQSAEEVARTLNPVCPGALDYPLFDIGRTWCVSGEANCCGEGLDRRCPLFLVCPRDRTRLDLTS